MNAVAPLSVFDAAAAERRHEAVIRGRQMEAIATWTLKDQLTLTRQIMIDITGDEYQRPEAKHAAVIALDAIDEIEAEQGWTRSVTVRGA